MSRRIGAGVAASLVLCMLLACSGGSDDEHDHNNFRADVIECEDALSRLERCCPGFDAAPVLCNYSYDHSSGCGSSATSAVTPAFDVHESACIRDTACDALVEHKVCERAQAARLYITNTTTSSSSSSGSSYDTAQGSQTTSDNSKHQAVCP